MKTRKEINHLAHPSRAVNGVSTVEGGYRSGAVWAFGG